jgi:glutathionylspermidine synthase
MEWEHELVQFDPGFRAASPTSRLDSFFVPSSNELMLTEYNAETPAAPAYNDVLSNAFLTEPVMGAFQKKYEVQPLPARHHMLHVILDAYQQWGGTERPTIGILDWKEVPTYSEFVLFRDYFRANGYDCIIADPREVDYRDGKLYAGDSQIHLIYKRVLISELVSQGGLNHPIIQAVLNRDVCMVNSFRCKVLYKKASLAVLSDEANAHLFTKKELKAIQRHVPWTRVMAERVTVYKGAPVDLVPFLQKRKDNFVLKPNDDYGGHGIILGWQASQSVWEAGLQTALHNPTVIQERITLPEEPYPSLIEGKVSITDRLFDTAPFVWDGSYVSSCLTRISTDPLLNVTSGGGSTVPTFIVEERD